MHTVKSNRIPKDCPQFHSCKANYFKEMVGIFLLPHREKGRSGLCESPGWAGAVVMVADRVVQERWLEGGGGNGGILGEDDSRGKKKGDTSYG